MFLVLVEVMFTKMLDPILHQSGNNGNEKDWDEMLMVHVLVLNMVIRKICFIGLALHQSELLRQRVNTRNVSFKISNLFTVYN